MDPPCSGWTGHEALPPRRCSRCWHRAGRRGPRAVDGWAADDEPTIDHVEATDDGLRVLVSVPAGADVDLAEVTGTLDGDPLDTTATSTGTDTDRPAHDGARDRHQRLDGQERPVRGGQGGRDDVPRHRSRRRRGRHRHLRRLGDHGPRAHHGPRRGPDVIDGLELSKGTLLYDGVLAAVELAGSDGQRSILVLSDGADTGDTALADVTAEIEETATLVDVVSLDQKNKPKAVAALTSLATAGQGRVIESTGAALDRRLRRRGRGAGAPDPGDRSTARRLRRRGGDGRDHAADARRRPGRQRVREDPGRARTAAPRRRPRRSTRTTAGRPRLGAVRRHPGVRPRPGLRPPSAGARASRSR